MSFSNDHPRLINFLQNAKKIGRSMHRNLAFFFMGTSLIYALSGMAFNHRGDWNPDKRFKEFQVQTDIDLNVEPRQLRKNLIQLIEIVAPKKHYGGHVIIDDSKIKVRFSDAGFIELDKNTGKGIMLMEVNRVFFFHANKLHKMPNDIWKWYSDMYACTLLFLVLSGLLIAKKGFLSIERWLLVAGVIAPIVILNF